MKLFSSMCLLCVSAFAQAADPVFSVAQILNGECAAKWDYPADENKIDGFNIYRKGPYADDFGGLHKVPANARTFNCAEWGIKSAGKSLVKLTAYKGKQESEAAGPVELIVVDAPLPRTAAPVNLRIE